MAYAYYNENDPYAAQWLRNLIKKGLISDGYVDEISIKDVDPDTLGGFSQYHFFAGIGGWAHAARLARWPDELVLVTGSCPCQPFSVAGKGRGTDDERHLWPDFNRLIQSIRAPVVMGEQVSGKAGHAWFDGVASDLEGQGYATGAVDIPACSVNAPHRRNRLYWVAHTDDARSQGRLSGWQDPEREDIERYLGRDGTAHRDSSLADGGGIGLDTRSGSPLGGEPTERGQAGSDAGNSGSLHGDVADTDRGGSGAERGDAGQVRGLSSEERGPEDGAPVSGGSGGEYGGHWGHALWATGSDGKARRVEPSIQLLAHGVPARVGKLRAFGNAIVPQVAAQVMMSFLESVK
jgi:DNA (cytosine-5)-methyltransferase 1